MQSESGKTPRIFNLKVIIRGCDTIFKEELGPGVIASQTLEFNLTDKEYKSPQFAVAMMEARETLLKDCFICEVEETT